MADQNRSKAGKPAKPKTDPERTERLPALRKLVDEHFTNWPTEKDNDAAGREK